MSQAGGHSAESVECARSVGEPRPTGLSAQLVEPLLAGMLSMTTACAMLQNHELAGLIEARYSQIHSPTIATGDMTSLRIHRGGSVHGMP